MERGLLIGAPADAPAAPAVYGDAPLGERARAWLDINCAHCHKAGGGASNSGLFLAWNETDPAGWGVRKRPTAAGHAVGTILPSSSSLAIPSSRSSSTASPSTEPGVADARTRPHGGR